MRYDFVCNHCKEQIDIQFYEFFNLYEEGSHEVGCPRCDETIHVNSIVNYSFEVTDEYGDEILD